MALVFPSCDSANITTVFDGSNYSSKCSTVWEYMTAEQVADSAGSFNITIEEAQQILSPWAALLASVFVARILFNLLAGQHGRA